MNQHPVVFANSAVLCPSIAFSSHTAILSYLNSIADSEGFAKLKALAVFRVVDIKRMFGDEVVQGFYLHSAAGLTYVSLRKQNVMDKASEEYVGDLFVIPNQVTNSIVPGGLENILEEFAKEYHPDEVPVVRMKILALGYEALEASNPDLVKRLNIVTYDVWKHKGFRIHFDFDLLHWVESPYVEGEEEDEIVEKKRINLKDIPLDNRNGRRLVRASMEKYREELTNAFIKSGAQITFDEWMTVNQGVCVAVLNDLAKIDALPDNEYVTAMIAFKKGEVQAMHLQQLNDKKTELHLFDWTLQHFGVEFEELGRAEAEAEIVTIGEVNTDVPEDEELEPAVFLVTFDGTIVEDHSPAVGPQTPFAIPVLKKLIEAGHQVIILTDRDNHDTRTPMLDFLKNVGVDVVGNVSYLPANGIIKGDFMHHVQSNDNVGKEWLIDYTIDHRQFGAPMVQVSGSAEHPPTMLWTDVIAKLTQSGYLTEEDLFEIQAMMSEEQ